MNRFVSVVVVALLPASGLLANPPAQPRGEPENAWRYVLFNGRWWYWMPDAEWALYDGRSWVTFQPQSIGSSLVGTDRDKPSGRSFRGRDRFYESLDANARSILQSTKPQTPASAAAIAPPVMPGGAIGGSSVSRIEIPPPRSGDAGSGVGGGSVGGTSVTGGAVGTPPR
jgi:hypothetical protein